MYCKSRRVIIAIVVVIMIKMIKTTRTVVLFVNITSAVVTPSFYYQKLVHYLTAKGFLF